jgi:hypothetical protein
MGPAGQWRLEKLLEAATDGYRAAFPSSELVEFDDGGSSYLFDLTDDSTVARAPRLVAAWRRTSVAATPRNRSRQAGFPVSPALAGRGYERGISWPTLPEAVWTRTCSPKPVTSIRAARLADVRTVKWNA